MRYRKEIDGENGTLLEISEFRNGEGVTEFNLVIKSEEESKGKSELVRRLDLSCSRFIQNEHTGVVAVFRRFFLSKSTYREQIEVQAKGQEGAVSIIEQEPLGGSDIVLWAYLQSGFTVGRLSDNCSGAIHNGYRHFWYTNGSSKEEDTMEQTVEIFNDYTTLLDNFGCSLLNNCIRTWIYVNDVDNNYSAMVDARNEVFVLNGLSRNTHYIASTGINYDYGSAHGAVRLDAYAISGLQKGQIRYIRGSSHLNCTVEYGVRFERGTVVDYGDRSHAFISGTASIDNRGEIVWPGDIVKQTRRMCENVGVLLAEAGFSYDDIGQIIIYLRHNTDYAAVNSYFEEQYRQIPKVILHAPVCRPGWLIEMECIAIKKGWKPAFAKF